MAYIIYVTASVICADQGPVCDLHMTCTFVDSECDLK